MVAELALSAVASLLILQSLFLLRVAMKSAEESSDAYPSSRSVRIPRGDHPRSSTPRVSAHAATGTQRCNLL